MKNKISKQFICPHCNKELKDISQLVSESIGFLEQYVVQGKNKDELTGEAKEQYEQVLSLMRRIENLYK